MANQEQPTKKQQLHYEKMLREIEHLELTAGLAIVPGSGLERHIKRPEHEPVDPN